MLLPIRPLITASFFDSLNPSATAAQILLQTMVRNKRHILFSSPVLGCQSTIGLAIYYAHLGITGLFRHNSSLSTICLWCGNIGRLVVSRSWDQTDRQNQPQPKQRRQRGKSRSKASRTACASAAVFDGCRLLLRGVDQRPAVFWILGSASELSVDISVSLRFYPVV